MLSSLGVGPLYRGNPHPSGRAEYPPPYPVGTAMGEHLRVESFFRISEHRLHYLVNNLGPKWNRRKCWSCGNIWSPTRAQCCTYCQKPLVDLRMQLTVRWEKELFPGFEAFASQRFEHTGLVSPMVIFYRDGQMLSVYHYNGERLLIDEVGPIPTDRLAISAHFLCRVLLFLHQRGCVIPRLSPANILIMPDDSVRLFDPDISAMVKNEMAVWKWPDHPARQNVIDLAQALLRLCPPEHQELFDTLHAGSQGKFEGVRDFGNALSRLYNHGGAAPVSSMAAALTDQGLVRGHNEDSWTWRKLPSGALLYAVADGMGGHDNGEVASELAIKTLGDQMAATAATAKGEELERELLQSFRTANQTVRQFCKSNGKQMGTTLVAVLLKDRKSVVCHAGDSRAYLLRAHQLTQITRDHTIVQELIDGGKVKSEDAKSHPRANMLTSSIGGEDGDLEVEVKRLELQTGDRLLLCSDGLHGLLSDTDIADLLTAHTRVDAVHELVKAAYEAGGIDNVTALVIDIP